MLSKKAYGRKKDYEPDVVQSMDSGNPSEVTNAAFIVATYKEKMRKESDRVGKWLLFVPEKNIDSTWQNVKKAVEAGKLWKKAKVSTAWRSKGGVYVVCVYTYDHEDAEDVMRIREYLREMGFKRPVSYKTDKQTLAGIYSDNTEEISKYRA
jgi:hypothetical protein